MVEIEEDYGISAQVAIVHGEGDLKTTRHTFPNRFVFAKYLSLSDVANFEVEKVVESVHKIRDGGYSLAKMWFGPRWLDYYENVPKDFRLDDQRLDPIFQALEDADIPLLLHVSDPDTYYTIHYQDSTRYGTKDDSLTQLEAILERHPRLLFQLPHFGSQPEIHHLSNLASWLSRFPRIMLDTASSRWMARELSKDPQRARDFLMKHSDRVMFGTDLSTNRGPPTYYEERYRAQRLLWETDVRNEPLPFEDADTKDSGGTFINGLDLPLSVLRKIYWENAIKTYGVPK